MVDGPRRLYRVLKEGGSWGFSAHSKSISKVLMDSGSPTVKSPPTRVSSGFMVQSGVEMLLFYNKIGSADYLRLYVHFLLQSIALKTPVRLCAFRESAIKILQSNTCSAM